MSYGVFYYKKWMCLDPMILIPVFAIDYDCKFDNMIE